MKKVTKFFIEAACGFVLWTAFLTPYMLFVVKVTSSQYLSWLVMQLVIVPPVAVPVVNITNWVVKRLTKIKKEE